MNLEDIAKKAGVSRSTVSRVINGAAYVSDKTRQRVMAVIEAEGYTPNLAARTLVTQRTEMIGVVIPDEFKDVFSDEIPYYYSALLQGISEATRQRDYTPLLWISQHDTDEGIYHHRVLKSRWMDGLLIVASLVGETALVSTLIKNKTPFVLIGHPIREKDRINFVSVDNVRAAQSAVKHLIRLGRRRIGALAGNAENADSQDRLEGYYRALKAANISRDPALALEGSFRQEWGYAGMKRLIEAGADAVFAFNDMIAVGAMQAIRDAGLRIPDDIAVVGFDDLPIASQVTPLLTSVRQPVAEKGAQAAALLLDLIDGRVNGSTQILLPTQLIVRESCGASAAQRR